MPHAIGHEAVLLTDDFGRNFEDCLGPLIQASRQPVGVLQAFRKEIAVGRLFGVRQHVRVVDIVDQNARQRLAVQLDSPAAVICGADDDVRHHRVGYARR